MFGWMTIAKLVGGAAILLAVGLGINAVKNYFENRAEERAAILIKKDAEINSLKEKVAGQLIDIDRLKVSNESLKVERDAKVEQIMIAREEMFKAQESDKKAQDELAKLSAEISSIERRERIEKIRSTEKATLVLRIANDNVACEAQHLFKRGRCVMGRFIPEKE
jgi:hypothetical protein